MGQACVRVTGRGQEYQVCTRRKLCQRWTAPHQADPDEKRRDSPSSGSQGPKVELICCSSPWARKCQDLIVATLDHGGVHFSEIRVENGSNAEVGEMAAAHGGVAIVHGNHAVAGLVAVAQYAADVGMYRSYPPTPQQRCLDIMILGAYAELQDSCRACLPEISEQGSGPLQAHGLLKEVKPILDGIERQYGSHQRGASYDEGEFLYRDSVPSLADLAVRNIMTSLFDRLEGFRETLDAYPNLAACAAACEEAVQDGSPRDLRESLCIPVVSGTPHLLDFERAGRGELTRLIMHAGGVEFRDQRLTRAEWPAIKADPSSLPSSMFGSLPCLRQGKFNFAQLEALAQYAADLGMYARRPPTPQQRSLDMMLIGAHTDLQNAMYDCLLSEGSRTKAKEALEERVAPILKAIDTHCSGAGGERPTLGDLAIFDAVTSSRAGLKALGVNLAGYRSILEAVKACQESVRWPGLKEYLRKRTSF